MKNSVRRGYTLIELAVVLVIIGVMAAILWPVSTHQTGNARRAACQSNLKQLGLAMIQYTQDYNDRFPPYALHTATAGTPPFARPYGWADAIQPYVKNTQILQCPSETNTRPGEDATKNGFTDYWFNTNLSAVSINKIPASYETFLLGEGNDGSEITNARYHRGALPAHWLNNENSPSYRHVNTASYLYADGHVKIVLPKYLVASNGFAVQRQ